MINCFDVGKMWSVKVIATDHYHFDNYIALLTQQNIYQKGAEL